MLVPYTGTMNEDAVQPVDLDPELNSTPLHVLAIEMTELSEELLSCGMPSMLVAQIISNMLSDAILYRIEFVEEDEEDEEDDLDSDGDSPRV